MSKIIYKPQGKAGEYSPWAANYYNGCTNACAYCFNNTGITAKTLGGENVRLKKQLVDEATALEIFKKELDKYREQIIADGVLHFNFVSDPCLKETIDLNWACISFALSRGVPCQVLTKRADWLDHPAVQNALTKGKDLLRVGFSLSGRDDLEPHASTNAERVEAMKQLSAMGVTTWASIEPILSPEASLDMVKATVDCCDYYKIGILSGKKDYTPQQIRDLKESVAALNPKMVYWKASLEHFIQKP